MVTRQLDLQTIHAIRTLVRTNYAARDELYAAANIVVDETKEQICRRLARFLASHASELQQLLLASGAKPVSKEEIPEIAETALLELLRAANGARGVMAAAEHHEHAVKDAYDVAVQSATDPDAKAILERQRGDVEFGERVLRCLQLDGSSGAPTAESKS